MPRFYLLIAVFMLALVPLPASAAQAFDEGPGGHDSTALNAVQEYIDRLDSEIKRSVPQLNFKETVSKLVKGEMECKPSEIFRSIINQLFKEVVANFDLLGKLVVLAVICAVLKNLVCSFEKGTTGQLTYSVTYLVLLTIAIGSFSIAINASRQVVDTLVAFMQGLTPVLLTLLVAVGGVASAAIFSPVVLTTLSMFGTLIKNIILPLFFFIAILGMVGNISDRFKVSNLANLLKTVAMWLMGTFSTIFLGVLAIQGVAGAVGDSVTFKTAKFSVDTFVPVVGRVFSDALAAVISSSLLIKNAVGIAGIAAIGTILLVPLVKIATLAFIYKLAGALVQPVGEGQIVGCLNDLGSNLLLVFAAVAIVGLLSFFTVTIIVCVGNVAVMLK